MEPARSRSDTFPLQLPNATTPFSRQSLRSRFARYLFFALTGSILHDLVNLIWLMEQTTSSVLGVRRSRHAKHKPKRFLRRLVNYMKSDSYMFASLISSSMASSSKRKYGLFAREGSCVYGAEDDVNTRKRKRFVEMIGEYLKSDSFLYAPLVEGECSGLAPKEIVDASHKGAPCLTKSVTTSIARTVLTRITNNQSTEELMGVVSKGQTEPFLDTNHEPDNISNQTLKQGDIVKQVVFPNCWTSLLSVGDNAGNSSIDERVVRRKKIPVE